MKFVPRAHLNKALAKVGQPLRLDGHIADIAMDGSRVALAVRDWRGGCDAVVFWNITWRYAIPITEEEERTCEWSRRGGSIESVSLDGLRAAWTIRVGDFQRVLAASSVDCFERIVLTARANRGERVLGHAGDDGVLAYAVARAEGGLLGRVGDRMRGETVASAGPTPSAVAADDRRIAVLYPAGAVQIRTVRGDITRTISVGDARAIALRAHRLLVLTPRSTIDVFDVRSGVRLNSWPVPTSVEPKLDVHFGVAVVTHGGLGYAISIANGRRVLVARAPANVRAEIEAPGVAYAYNDSGRGVVKYVPYTKIERLLRG